MLRYRTLEEEEEENLEGWNQALLCGRIKSETPVKYPSGVVEQAIGGMNLGLRREIRVGNLHLEALVISLVNEAQGRLGGLQRECRMRKKEAFQLDELYQLIEEKTKECGENRPEGYKESSEGI